MLLLGWMQEGASNVVNNLPYKKKAFHACYLHSTSLGGVELDDTESSSLGKTSR